VELGSPIMIKIKIESCVSGITKIQKVLNSAIGLEDCCSILLGCFENPRLMVDFIELELI